MVVALVFGVFASVGVGGFMLATSWSGLVHVPFAVFGVLGSWFAYRSLRARVTLTGDRLTYYGYVRNHTVRRVEVLAVATFTIDEGGTAPSLVLTGGRTLSLQALATMTARPLARYVAAIETWWHVDAVEPAITTSC